MCGSGSVSPNRPGYDFVSGPSVHPSYGKWKGEPNAHWLKTSAGSAPRTAGTPNASARLSLSSRAIA